MGAWHAEVAPRDGTQRWHQGVAPSGSIGGWHQGVAWGTSVRGWHGGAVLDWASLPLHSLRGLARGASPESGAKVAVMVIVLVMLGLG